jgi:hypothetical protein
MVDASDHQWDDKPRRNADGRWETFSSHEYWRVNYKDMQAEDQEIIGRVNRFFRRVFNGRPGAQRAIDVGSGTNLYPALLMLPWTEQILLTDHSESNVRWLRGHVMDDDVPWAWHPFWRKMRGFEGYRQIDEPRGQLRRACTGHPGQAGIEQRSVFDLRVHHGGSRRIPCCDRRVRGFASAGLTIRRDVHGWLVRLPGRWRAFPGFAGHPRRRNGPF